MAYVFFWGSTSKSRMQRPAGFWMGVTETGIGGRSEVGVDPAGFACSSSFGGELSSLKGISKAKLASLYFNLTSG